MRRLKLPAMDLNKAIRDLYDELEKLNQVIASLEEYERTGTLPAPPHRGRKFMGEDERKVVSERMKKYWGSQRRDESAGA